MLGDDVMTNPIQAIRNVYDIVKGAKDNEKTLTAEEINYLLEKTVSDKSLISKYPRFEKRICCGRFIYAYIFFITLG